LYPKLLKLKKPPVSFRKSGFTFNETKPRAFRGPRLISFFLKIPGGRPHKYDYYDEQSYTGLYLNSATV
jgi:hypothetical protein